MTNWLFEFVLKDISDLSDLTGPQVNERAFLLEDRSSCPEKCFLGEKLFSDILWYS